MRTTLTLDDDVAKQIERIRKQRGLTLRDIVNEALRAGLPRIGSSGRARKRHVTKAISAGRCLVGGVDDVAGILAVVEGDGFR